MQPEFIYIDWEGDEDCPPLRLRIPVYKNFPPHGFTGQLAQINGSLFFRHDTRWVRVRCND